LPFEVFYIYSIWAVKCYVVTVNFANSSPAVHFWAFTSGAHDHGLLLGLLFIVTALYHIPNICGMLYISSRSISYASTIDVMMNRNSNQIAVTPYFCQLKCQTGVPSVE